MCCEIWIHCAFERKTKAKILVSIKPRFGVGLVFSRRFCILVTDLAPMDSLSFTLSISLSLCLSLSLDVVSVRSFASTRCVPQIRYALFIYFNLLYVCTRCIHVLINLTVRHLVFRWPGVTFTTWNVEFLRALALSPCLLLSLLIWNLTQSFTHYSGYFINDYQFFFCFGVFARWVKRVRDAMWCDNRTAMNKQNQHRAECREWVRKVRVRATKKKEHNPKQTNKQNEWTNEHWNEYANNKLHFRPLMHLT